VTNVCDVISLMFSFEEADEREVRGYHVAADGLGAIEVDPWPFAVSRLAGLVAGFAADGYPARLVPVPMAYDVQPAR
jgi:hypothetical protein